jgi:hypothetical protein
VTSSSAARARLCPFVWPCRLTSRSPSTALTSIQRTSQASSALEVREWVTGSLRPGSHGEREDRDRKLSIVVEPDRRRGSWAPDAPRGTPSPEPGRGRALPASNSAAPATCQRPERTPIGLPAGDPAYAGRREVPLHAQTGASWKWRALTGGPAWYQPSPSRETDHRLGVGKEAALVSFTDRQ